MKCAIRLCVSSIERKEDEMKWSVGPVLLKGGDKAHIDFIQENVFQHRYIGRVFTFGRDGKQRWMPMSWSDNGAPVSITGKRIDRHVSDLFSLHSPQAKLVTSRRYVNVNHLGISSSDEYCLNVFYSRQAASTDCPTSRSACIDLTLEVEEGLGLAEPFAVVVRLTKESVQIERR